MVEKKALERQLVEDPKDDFTQKPVAKSSEHKMVVLGDLHANALKLLHFLVKQNIVDISKEDYEHFKNLYFKTPQDIEGMQTLIAEKITVKQNTPFLRFLGDELADRGQNDFYTLLLFKKLDEANVQFDINQSNHTVEFSLAHEKVSLGKKSKGYVSDFLGMGQARSLFKLNQAIKQGKIKQDTLNSLVNIHQKHQTLISYSLSDDKKNITLSSHAPVDYKIVQSLAAKFKTDYNDKTPEQLAMSIERINKAYRQCVRSKTLGDSVHVPAMSMISRRRFNYEQMLKHHPLELMVWSRNYHNIDRTCVPNNWEKAGYALSYMHGHDSNSIPPPNVICLDSMSGKNDKDNQCGWAYDDMGEYEIKNPVAHVDEGVLHTLDCLIEQVKEEMETLIALDIRKLKLTQSPELRNEMLLFQSKLKGLADNADHTSVDLCDNCIQLVQSHQQALKKDYSVIEPSWINTLISLLNYCRSYLELTPLKLYTTLEHSPVNQSYKDNVQTIKNKMFFFKSEIQKREPMTQETINGPPSPPTK